MDIPRDGRTLTLTQAIQRGRRYWYITWADDAGKRRSHYIGRNLPDNLLTHWIEVQVAHDQLQAAIRLAFPKRAKQEAS